MLTLKQLREDKENTIARLAVKGVDASKETPLMAWMLP